MRRERALDQASKVSELSGAEAVAQRAAVEDGLDGRLSHDECLRAPFGDTTFTGERAIVPGQHDPENEDRNQAHERVRSQAAPERAGRSRGGLHQ